MNMFYVHLILLNQSLLKTLVEFERRGLTSVGFFNKVTLGTAEGLLYFINTYIPQFKYYNSGIKKVKQEKMEKVTQRGSFLSDITKYYIIQRKGK
jgi:hypothetical protein